MARSPKTKREKEEDEASAQGDDVEMDGAKESEEEDEEEDGEIFIVERLKAAQFGRLKPREWAYYVVWEGYDVAAEWTWEPVENLDGCPEILAAFWKDQPIGPDDPVEKGHKLTFPPKSAANSRRKSTVTPAPSSTSKKRGRTSIASSKKEKVKEESGTEAEVEEESKKRGQPAKGKENGAKGRKSAVSTAEEDEVDGDLAEAEQEEEDPIDEFEQAEGAGAEEEEDVPPAKRAKRSSAPASTTKAAAPAAKPKPKPKPRTSKPVTSPSSSRDTSPALLPASSTIKPKPAARSTKPFAVTNTTTISSEGFEGVIVAEEGDMADHMADEVDWDALVDRVVTVEKMKDDEAEDVDEDEARLWVYLALKDGSQHKVRIANAKKRCPGALIDFFVIHLRWRTRTRD